MIHKYHTCVMIKNYHTCYDTEIAHLYYDTEISHPCHNKEISHPCYAKEISHLYYDTEISHPCYKEISHLCYDTMQYIDKDVVEGGRRLWVETNLEKVVVVRRDTEAGQKAVDHQVNVLTNATLAARKWLRRIEQQTLNFILIVLVGCYINVRW